MEPRPAVILLVALVLTPALAGCTTAPPDADVLATFYPLRFLTERIAGDAVSVGTVVKEGTEPHDWEPSPRDIARLGRSQLVIAQGLGFEPWLDEAIHSLGRGAPLVQRTAESLDAHHKPWDHLHDEDEAHDDHDDDPEENTTSGNETHIEHHHALDVPLVRAALFGRAAGEQPHDDHDHGHAHEDHDGVDPHTWLDPVLFAQQAVRIRDALSILHPEHEAAFHARTDDLLHDLEDLHDAFQERLADCQISVIVTQHDAFSRLTERYGLSVVSVAGLDPEAETDARRIDNAIRTVRENDIPFVFAEPGGNERVMQQIADETDAEVQVLHPLEGRTLSERRAGDTYLDLMHQNLDRLSGALRCT